MVSTDNRSKTIAGLSVAGVADWSCSTASASAASIASTRTWRVALCASIARFAAATVASLASTPRVVSSHRHCARLL